MAYLLVVFLKIVRKSTSASCLERKNCFELSSIEIAEMQRRLKIIGTNLEICILWTQIRQIRNQQRSLTFSLRTNSNIAILLNCNKIHMFVLLVLLLNLVIFLFINSKGDAGRELYLNLQLEMDLTLIKWFRISTGSNSKQPLVQTILKQQLLL